MQRRWRQHGGRLVAAARRLAVGGGQWQRSIVAVVHGGGHWSMASSDNINSDYFFTGFIAVSPMPRMIEGYVPACVHLIRYVFSFLLVGGLRFLYLILKGLTLILLITLGSNILSPLFKVEITSNLDFHAMQTIAMTCMFLAGKVEETPRPLKDVILVSYEIIHKKDPAAIQEIKQKDVYEQQKELILLGERVVLATLGFDLNVQHPYKPLVEAIKKFKVAQNALAQVAWNFVNDGYDASENLMLWDEDLLMPIFDTENWPCRLRTSLCLQFKPHHIAAGAIFLAAKFLKVKLPSDGDKVWWQEFDVPPRQLEGWSLI